MPYFNILLKTYATGLEKSRWKNSKSATHPVTGDTVELAILSLKFADNTLLLSDVDDVVIPDHGAALSHITHTALCVGWPEVFCSGCYDFAIQPIIKAHKALIAMMYGYPIRLSALIEREEDNATTHESRLSAVHAAVDIVKLMGAYAEFYAGFDSISSKLRDMLSADRRFWKAVAHRPKDYVALSQKLRDENLYFDAVRHLIAQAPQDQYADFTAVFDMSTEDAKAWIQPLHEHFRELSSRLEGELSKLQLSESWSTSGGRNYKPLTTFANMLQFKHADRSEGIKAQENVALLARMIYGQ